MRSLRKKAFQLCLFSGFAMYHINIDTFTLIFYLVIIG